MPAVFKERHRVGVVTEETFGESLKQRRKAAGLTPSALSRLSRIDRGQISRIESGEVKRPHDSTVRALMDALERYEQQLKDDAGPYDEPSQTQRGDFIEFDITGDFGVHLVVKGPVHDAEVLKRQVVDIIREIRNAEKNDPSG